MLFSTGGPDQAGSRNLLLGLLW